VTLAKRPREYVVTMHFPPAGKLTPPIIEVKHVTFRCVLLAAAALAIYHHTSYQPHAQFSIMTYKFSTCNASSVIRTSGDSSTLCKVVASVAVAMPAPTLLEQFDLSEPQPLLYQRFDTVQHVCCTTHQRQSFSSPTHLWLHCAHSLMRNAVRSATVRAE
jgi:hypothetical protein